MQILERSVRSEDNDLIAMAVAMSNFSISCNYQVYEFCNKAVVMFGAKALATLL